MRIVERNIAGAFIFSSDNKILLGKTGVYDGQWVVPGGGINEGESNLEAAKREVLEETGLDIENQEIKVIEEIDSGESEKTLANGERVLVKMKFFDFEVCFSKPAKDISPVAGDDLKELGWFTGEELANMSVSPPTRKYLVKIGFIKS